MLTVYNQFLSKNEYQWLTIESNNNKIERRLKKIRKSSYQNISR